MQSEKHVLLPFPTRVGQTSTLNHSRPELKGIGLLTPVTFQKQFSPVRVEKPETILGRDPDADVVLNHESVSRKHARLTRKHNEFYLEDLGSSNGTHVDDVPVLSSILRAGDLVQLGKIAFWFDVLLEERSR